MSLPVRCFTCNKCIGQFEQRWIDRVNKIENSSSVAMGGGSGNTPESLGAILDEFGMVRYCCRRMFMGYVNILDQLLEYVVEVKDNDLTEITTGIEKLTVCEVVPSSQGVGTGSAQGTPRSVCSSNVALQQGSPKPVTVTVVETRKGIRS